MSHWFLIFLKKVVSSIQKHDDLKNKSLKQEAFFLIFNIKSFKIVTLKYKQENVS